MKPVRIILLLALTQPLLAGEKSWPPTRDPSLGGGRLNSPTAGGRELEVFQHGVKAEWGYKAPQQDTFVLIHPKQAGKTASSTLSSTQPGTMSSPA